MDESPSRKKIVLADDEHFIAIAYKKGLEQAGYEVLVAHDGEEALLLVRTHNPDLLLLDIIMPKVNGFEVLQEMRDDATLSATAVIVLTNLSQESDEQEARKYGAHDFVTKADVSLNDLLTRIQRVLY